VSLALFGRSSESEIRVRIETRLLLLVCPESWESWDSLQKVLTEVKEIFMAWCSVVAEVFQ
jgi:hypothetical protein